MNQTLKKLLICSGVLAITLSGCGSSESPKEKEAVKEEEKIKLITNSLYVEPLNPSNAQIKAFNKLSKAVEEKNYEEEAKMAAVSFAFDFFTLSNKKSSEDVGGLQFIPTKKIYRFKEFAQPYYYNNYSAIVNENGKDSLPEVTGYKVASITAGNYTYNGNACEGYDVELTLTYGESKIKKEKLKTKLKISVISISDFPYNRSLTYKDDGDFIGDRINVYRVLSVE